MRLTVLAHASVLLWSLLVQASSAGATGVVLFEEDFNDGSADGISIDYGAWSITTRAGFSGYCYYGHFSHVGNPWGTKSYITLDTPFQRSIAVDVDFTLQKYYSDFYGEVCRDYDPENGTDMYRANIYPTNADNSRDELYKYVQEGSATRLDTAGKYIGQTAISHFRIERWNSTGEIKVYLNGQLRMSAVDTEFTDGQVRLGFHAGGWLDNIRVTTLEDDEIIPEPATMLAGLAGLAGLGRYIRLRKNR